MSKNHIENLAEQIASKRHVSALFHKEKKPNQASEAANSENISTIVADENSSIQLRAYQIHLDKGGSDLDNWLEAERSLKNSQLK
jgi:hypothetical protein